MSIPDRLIRATSGAPLCLCGCGKQVGASKKLAGYWNNYYSRHTSRCRKTRYASAPRCLCGCGMNVSWGVNGWRKHADHIPLVREIEAHLAPLYSMAQVAAKLTSRESAKGASLRTLERRMKKPGFPKPILARVDDEPQLRKLFVREEIDDYLKAQQKTKHAKHRSQRVSVNRKRRGPHAAKVRTRKSRLRKRS